MQQTLKMTFKNIFFCELKYSEFNEETFKRQMNQVYEPDARADLKFRPRWCFEFRNNCEEDLLYIYETRNAFMGVRSPISWTWKNLHTAFTTLLTRV